MNGLRGAFLAALATAGIAFAGPAEALTFNFSITNTTGNTGAFPGGIVTGEIFGLTDNSTSAASAVFVDTVPVNYPTNSLTYPFDTMTAIGAIVGQNGFTVANGVITVASFSVQSTFVGSEFALQLITQAPAFAFTIESNSSTQISDSGATFTPVSTTPLPAAFPLFASGLGAFGLLLRRRKRKTSAAFATA